MIERQLEKSIAKRLSDKKVIIILGPRQTGKTTLIKKLFKGEKTLHLNGDEPDVRNSFKNATSSLLSDRYSKYDYLIIDEAQRIEDIGLNIKLIHDNIDDLKVVITGSSAFELANRMNEPLTGRKWEFMIFPLSLPELVGKSSFIEEKRLLPERLVYGGYPEVINNPGDRREVLTEITSSYLFKDILSLENIRHSSELIRLLKLISYQVGGEVSINELSRNLSISSHTVDKYIDLLEKTFVLFRLDSYSRNHRKEIRKSKKIYFYDNGIMNAVVGDYTNPENRNDTGRLWENYIVSEIVKKHSYERDYSNMYFWRTKDGQEVDLVIERDGKLNAIEIKYSKTKKARLPGGFTNSYPNSSLTVITPDNYIDYLMSPFLVK